MTAEHGSYAAYQLHMKTDRDPCTPCTEAAAAYQREYRTKHPESRKRQTRVYACRRKALADLVALHPEQFESLYAIRRQEAGL